MVRKVKADDIVIGLFIPIMLGMIITLVLGIIGTIINVIIELSPDNQLKILIGLIQIIIIFVVFWVIGFIGICAYFFVSERLEKSTNTD